MEPDNNQSPFVRILIKIARFIGIYLLSVSIIYFLGQKGLFLNLKFSPILFFLFAFVLLPLVWALSKNFFAGFLKYALLTGGILAIAHLWPKPDNSITSNDSSQDSFSYVGRYSVNENGILVEIVAGTDTWYGKTIEGTTGGLINRLSGSIRNNLLYDEFNNEVGEIRKDELIITLDGFRLRLKKN